MSTPSDALAAEDVTFADAIYEQVTKVAKDGLMVFPLRQWLPNDPKNDGKIPAVVEPLKERTTDQSKIDKWYGPGGTHRGYNYAIATGQYGDDLYLVAVDLDRKKGKDGVAAFTAKCAEHQIDLKNYITLTQATPNNGLHLLYWSDTPIKPGVDVNGMEGVDVRCRGGYVVGAGSVADGAAYRREYDRPIANIGELAAILPKDGEVKPSAAGVVLPNIDADRAEKRAIRFLTEHAPVTEGERNHAAFKAAAECKDQGCDQDTTLALMVEHFQAKCSSPLDDDELATVVRSAYKNGKEPQGSKAPEAILSVVKSKEGEPLSPLAELNRQFAHVIIGKNGYILSETENENGKIVTDFLLPSTFHDHLASKTFTVGKTTKPLTRAWMEWPERRSYRRITFAPGKEVPAGIYNLWRGFGVEAKKGDWSAMRAHIRENICSGDDALFSYVMGWMALAVQKPGERGWVALVLRGLKGTGKGALGHWMRRIFGNHGLHIANAEHLVGRFNSHLQCVAMLFADEAFFAGDRKHESVLKSIITEPKIMIEAKGKDAVDQDNCLHLIMASNSDWVVPASADERRYCVIDVADTRQGDQAYFKDLERRASNGGLEAMLYDLLHYDVSKFNVQIVPQTAALADQKLQGLQGAERWLYCALLAAKITDWNDWPENETVAVSKSGAFDDYVNKSGKLFREHRPEGAGAFWKKLSRILGPAGFRNERRVGADGARHREVILPPLDEARAAFERYMKACFDWSGDAL